MKILTAELSPDERLYLAEALLLRRYAGHHLKSGVPDNASEVQAHIALRLAKRLGVFDEYWRVMQRTDVLSVSVRNLDGPKQRGPRRKAGR